MERPSTETPGQPSEAQEPPKEGLARRQVARVQARLQPVVRMAEAIVDKVRLQMVLALLSGLWLWGLIFFPFSSFDSGLMIVLGVVVAVLLLSPAGVLWLFWGGLQGLIRVPDKLVAMAGQGDEQTDVLIDTVTGRTEPRKSLRLLRSFRIIFDLRRLILDSQGLLLKFTVVARLANPFFIGIFFVAFLLSLVLIFVAAVSFIGVMVF